MRISALCDDLRATSDRFGGIPDMLTAADQLDRAISAFFRSQDFETLQDLNGAIALGLRLRGWVSNESEGPVAQ